MVILKPLYFFTLTSISIISSKVVEVIGPKVDIPRWKDAKTEIRKLMGI